MTRFLLSWILLFSLAPAPAAAQDAEAVEASLVRIVGKRFDETVRGSGFVVAKRDGAVTVVTASHVIQGLWPDFEVYFTVSTTRFEPYGIVGMGTGDDGLAVFEVRGTIPAGVRALAIETEARPRLAEPLLLAGFPGGARSAVFLAGILASRSGSLLLVDRPVAEGGSGGPLVRGGRAVGLVTRSDGQLSYAVNAAVLREALLGWRVELDGGTRVAELPPPPAVAPPPPPPACENGEEDEDEKSGITFVRICAGTFTMGSADDDPHAEDDEKPAHEVTLSEYWIAKHETTNAQYRRFKPRHQGEDTLPVTSVTWHDADEFCRHFGFGLPTEAQWEYAARAGSTTAWSFGDDDGELGRYAWCWDNSDGRAQPVGTRDPNRWGLHDMHGNALEWVGDWYGPYSAEAQRDPSGPLSGKIRVLRGGAFPLPPRFLRSAVRRGDLPGGSHGIAEGVVGFRCVLRR